MRNVAPLLLLLTVVGCGSPSRGTFHADVLAPGRIEPSEQRTLVRLGRTVSASGWRHFILLFVPLGDRPDLESIVREAIADAPGATAIVDAEVSFGDTAMGPLPLLWYAMYVRVEGTAAGPPPVVSR